MWHSLSWLYTNWKGGRGAGKRKKPKPQKTFWSFATVAMPVVVGWQDADVLNGAPARRR